MRGVFSPTARKKRKPVFCKTTSRYGCLSPTNTGSALAAAPLFSWLRDKQFNDQPMGVIGQLKAGNRTLARQPLTKSTAR